HLIAPAATAATAGTGLVFRREAQDDARDIVALGARERDGAAAESALERSVPAGFDRDEPVRPCRPRREAERAAGPGRRGPCAIVVREGQLGARDAGIRLRIEDGSLEGTGSKVASGTDLDALCELDRWRCQLRSRRWRRSDALGRKRRRLRCCLRRRARLASPP